MSIQDSIKSTREKALKELNEIKSEKELQEFRITYLSKKGKVSSFMKHMKEIDASERKAFGATVNEFKNELVEKTTEMYAEIERRTIEETLKTSKIDVTLEGKEFPIGKKNILTKTAFELEDFFIGMGYSIEEGPEIETEENNFEKLNLPKDHPARDMQDTFYITNNTLLRSQTSPVQVRTMLAAKGTDIKMICPGKVYRRDDDDATHSHQFMQLEGLVVDKETNLADLKGTLLAIAKKLFGEGTDIRLRPSYFPFTEPSFEVDVSCFNCHGKGCNICKNTGWIEILGAGMVHRNVLEACGYDPDVYQGFAFGVGIERCAMLKYSISDIRNIYTNDKRFMDQF